MTYERENPERVQRLLDQLEPEQVLDQGFWRDELTALVLHCGFTECGSGDLELGYEKIAIYGSGEDFDHVAFQRVDGTSSSKLGEGRDIHHNTLTALSGPGVFEYAPVILFMKRLRRPHPLAESGLILP